MKLSIGPGALVAAAFIGPGTVTTCTLAGANFGFALLWTLVFATLATIILQDMAARLGAGARLGLGEALLQSTEAPAARIAVAVLVAAAIGLGNAAYEAGNLAGAALGVEAVFEDYAPRRAVVATLALIAASLLIINRYELIERVLIGFVILMSLAFVGAAALTRPDVGAMLAGLVPRVPEGGLLTAIALIGTTIVPYNLFLHAAAAKRRFEAGEVAEARADTAVSIGIGGLVSMLIVATAATALFGKAATIDGAAGLAGVLEPTYGAAAKYLIGFGLFAAGLTSTITAPLATGYALSEILPIAEDRRDAVVRITALTILIIGAGVALLGLRPVTLILIAQAANGILLPLVAVFLLIVMNRRALLGAYANGLAANIAGWLVVAVAAGLGLRGLLRAAGVL